MRKERLVCLLSHDEQAIKANNFPQEKDRNQIAVASINGLLT